MNYKLFTKIRSDKTLTKREALIVRIYTELYLQATPSVDFVKMVKESKVTLNKDGFIYSEFHYKDYKLEYDSSLKIIKKHAKESKYNEEKEEELRLDIMFFGACPSSPPSKSQD